MDYPFVHRGLLREELEKALSDSMDKMLTGMKQRMIGRYVRESGKEPLKIIDITCDKNPEPEDGYLHSNHRFLYSFVLEERNGKQTSFVDYKFGNLELIDDPTNPW